MPPSWHPVPACTRNGHSAGWQFINAATTAAGGTIQYCDNGLPQAGLLYYAKKKIGIGRVTVAATTAAGGPFFFEATIIRIGRGSVAATPYTGGTILLCGKEN